MGDYGEGTRIKARGWGTLIISIQLGCVSGFATFLAAAPLFEDVVLDIIRCDYNELSKKGEGVDKVLFKVVEGNSRVTNSGETRERVENGCCDGWPDWFRSPHLRDHVFILNFSP